MVLTINKIFLLQVKYFENLNFFKRAHHIYCNVNSYPNSTSFVDDLCKNIIYNDGNVVVINKPYGVGLRKPKHDSTARFAHPIKSFYLEDALESLTKHLGYNTLKFVKVPERYTSGITLLARNENEANRIKNCLNKGNNESFLQSKYVAVVVGCPIPKEGKFKCALRRKESEKFGAKMILETTWSKNEVKRRDVKVIKVQHRTLHQSNLASLVEISPTSVHKHFIRIYLSYLLSPMLGDHFYSSRVQYVLGKAVAVSPFSDIAQRPQVLQPQFLKAISVEENQEKMIPAHVHFSEQTLVNFFGKGKNLVLEAKVPEYFEWTCEKLELECITKLSSQSQIG